MTQFSLQLWRSYLALECRVTGSSPNTYVCSCASVRSAAYLTNTCSPEAPHPRSRAERAMRSPWPVRSCCSRTTTSATGRSQGTNPTGEACVSGHPCPTLILIAQPCEADLHEYARDNRCRPLMLACVPLRHLRQRQSGAHRQRKRATRRRPVRKNRRRPTLPGPCEPSTIGAEGLNCSVRNGKRCFPLAIATGKGRETALEAVLGPSKLHSATASITRPCIGRDKKSVKPSTN